MRDRLIELITESDILCHTCGENSYSYCAEAIADLIITDGWIRPPCKVGDMVYVIKYCRCNNPECFTQGHCHKKIVKHTPRVYAQIMKLQQGMKLKSTWSGNLERVWQPIGTICYKVIQKPFELKMLTEVGKTVFLNLNDAEKVLDMFRFEEGGEG